MYCNCRFCEIINSYLNVEFKWMIKAKLTVVGHFPCQSWWSWLPKYAVLAKMFNGLDSILKRLSLRNTKNIRIRIFHGLVHRFIQNTLLTKKDSIMRQSPFIFQCLTKHFKCKTCLEKTAEEKPLFLLHSARWISQIINIVDSCWWRTESESLCRAS